MRDIWAVTFPFFALVLCGYGAARGRLLPLEAVPGLNGFVLFFALPCMLYRMGASTPMAQLLDATVLAVWLVCGVLMVAATVALTLGARIRWNDAAFGALVAAFPNTGFMGVPLLAALLGAQAAAPVIVSMLVDMVVITSLCIALSRLDAANTQGMAVALQRALRGMLRNPMPWAIVLGGVASWAQFSLPGPLHKTVGLLADAASPVALFTIGAVLARAPMRSAAPPQPGMLRTALRDDAPVVLLKLLVHPLLVGVVGWGAMQLGAGLTPQAYTTLVLAAALPSASNVSLLAERFGADNGRIARIILGSTVGAFFTFSGAVAWMV